MDFKQGDRVMVDLPGCFSRERTATVASLHPALPNCLRVLVDGTVFTVPKDCCRKVEVLGGPS